MKISDPEMFYCYVGLAEQDTESGMWRIGVEVYKHQKGLVEVRYSAYEFCIPESAINAGYDIVAKFNKTGVMPTFKKGTIEHVRERY